MNKNLEKSFNLVKKSGYLEALSDILEDLIVLKKEGYLITIDNIVEIIIKLRNK